MTHALSGTTLLVSPVRTLFDQMLEIADTPQIGTKTVTKATGTETIVGDMIEHRRLQVDTRKWMLAKALPNIYGDKVTAELSGPDGGPIKGKRAH